MICYHVQVQLSLMNIMIFSLLETWKMLHCRLFENPLSERDREILFAFALQVCLILSRETKLKLSPCRTTAIK